jgi:hypothetical protein
VLLLAVMILVVLCKAVSIRWFAGDSQTALCAAVRHRSSPTAV